MLFSLINFVVNVWSLYLSLSFPSETLKNLTYGRKNDIRLKNSRATIDEDVKLVVHIRILIFNLFVFELLYLTIS